MGLSERIIALRTSKGITQTFIAECLNMDRGNYSRLEKRGEKMTVEQLIGIAKALGVSLGELLEEKVSGDANQLTEIKEQGLEMGYLKELLDSKKKEIESIKAAVKDFLSAELYKELIFYGEVRYKNIKTDQVVVPIVSNEIDSGVEKGYIKETLVIDEDGKQQAYEAFIFKYYSTLKLLFRLELIDHKDKELKAYWEKFKEEYGDRMEPA